MYFLNEDNGDDLFYGKLIVPRICVHDMQSQANKAKKFDGSRSKNLSDTLNIKSFQMNI